MSNDIDDIRQEGMPTELEQLEVRRALCKASLPVPDVDAEWEKFRLQEERHWKQQSDNQASANTNADGQETPAKELTAPLPTGEGPGVRLFLLVSAAAAIALLLILFPWPFASRKTEVFTAKEEAKDIVITAEDGTTTVVPKGKTLAYNQPMSQKAATEKSLSPKMLELSVPRGENGEVTLADGTHVWLNADSKISFPDKFVGKERKVKVSGEVYFEVTKDARRPFVVSTDYFSTTVYGTAFNVRAYSEKDASVTLVNGSVSVAPGKGEAQMLVPGQMAKCDGGGTLAINDVDVYPLTQWKDGYFYYNDAPLLEIMMALGRWYNVSVVFEHEEDMQRRLHFVAEHQESLQNIVERLNELGIVSVRMERDHLSIE